MERLWAPWRMKFIKDKVARKRCIFCSNHKETKDSKNFIIERGEFNYVMLNIYPYAPGHIMISPYRHVKELDKMLPTERSEMMELTAKFIPILKKVINADGFNIGFNQGKSAGGSYKHIHQHIVPRWEGDTNFILPISNTKTFPEILKDTYKRIMKELK